MPLLTARAALIFSLSILVGVGAGILTALDGHSIAAAVLTGVTAGAAAIALLDRLIEPPTPPTPPRQPLQ